MTTRPGHSLAPAYFEALYAAQADPWDFAGSPYERDKYAHTLSVLRATPYDSVFEAGCSIGVLTRLLASRCRSLLSVDAAATPLTAARARCSRLPHVRFERRELPREWPAGRFDLIVLSEICYYWNRSDLLRAAKAAAESLTPAGEILLVHWTGETDYPLSGDEAAEFFIRSVRSTMQPVHQARRTGYRLDLLRGGEVRAGDPAAAPPPRSPPPAREAG